MGKKKDNKTREKKGKPPTANFSKGGAFTKYFPKGGPFKKYYMGVFFYVHCMDNIANLPSDV